MDKKQLEAAKAIMNFSKIFADSMRESMVHSGLLDEDFKLNVDVAPFVTCSDGAMIKNTITLSNGEERYIMFKYLKEGWKVLEEPKDDTGSVQSSVCKVQPDKGYPGKGTHRETELPSDGLWVSIHDEPNHDADMVV